jgi:hypothetical protein
VRKEIFGIQEFIFDWHLVFVYCQFYLPIKIIEIIKLSWSMDVISSKFIAGKCRTRWMFLSGCMRQIYRAKMNIDIQSQS